MADPDNDDSALKVCRHVGETDQQAMARVLLDPAARHGFAVGSFIAGSLGGSVPLPGGVAFAEAVENLAKAAESGDVPMVSRALAAQALTLDAIFVEFTRRVALNLGGFPDAVERYARLALKAQSNSRATLEALARLHQPREQIVRQVHVSEGGQAIVADQVNHYARGTRDHETDEQSQATGPTGGCSSMLSQDTEGERVPVTGSEGKEALPNARRYKSGRTQR